MSTTRWPRTEATILRHLARRSPPVATADAVAAATDLPPDDVTYALEALYRTGEVDTAVAEGGVRRWWLAGRAGDARDRGGAGGR